MKLFLPIIFFVVVFVCSSPVAADDDEGDGDEEQGHVSGAWWDGYVAYFAVSKEKVATKLAELQGKADSECDSDGLVLPDQPILPGVLDLQPDQHVVAVSFGKIMTRTLPEEQLEQLREEGPLSKVADTVQFFIPFLTVGDSDDNKYKLALGSFVSTSSGNPYANPNPYIPTESVDSIVISAASGVVVKDGGYELFNLSSLPPVGGSECVALDEATEEAFEDYNNQYTVSFDSPCDYCQYWIHKPLDAECNPGAFRVAAISSKFQELSLLTPDQSPSILSVANRGKFSIQIKESCFD